MKRVKFTLKAALEWVKKIINLLTFIFVNINYSKISLGNGTFNLMISLLPARVIKLLEFIGFSGNKQMGIQDLMVGSKMTGLRQILCVMTLLGYHLIVCYVLSHQDGDLALCDEMLKQQLVVSLSTLI